MMKSMTGFGKAAKSTKYGSFTAEFKTLNHKFLEITFKLPNSLAVFDEKVKSLIKSKLTRGKVYLNFTHENEEDSQAAEISIDNNLAKAYYNRLKSLKKKLKIQDPIHLTDITSFPGVINYKPMGKNILKVWPTVKAVIDEALGALLVDRKREGKCLWKDISGRVVRVKAIVADIQKKSLKNVKSYKKQLLERIKELSGGYQVDRGRLEIEVALFAKNTDISEELTRLKNHLDNFMKTMKANGEIGKKLDFISQELHREINTVGSKSSGFNISKGVIEIKTEIEKIREQLKNIE